MSFNIIVACDLNNGIGKNNKLLYKLKNDMKYFKDITTTVENKFKKNAVIMGRKTYESIPTKHRPLPNRLNIVITRNKNYPIEDNLLIAKSLNDALEQIKLNNEIENIFVIGGGEIYETALNHKNCNKIYLTKIYDESNADIFFPKLDNSYEIINESSTILENNVKCFNGIKDIEYKFLVYKKVKKLIL